jgi:hypothetical protein
VRAVARTWQCFSVLQTTGTFVIVLSSAFHFGYNLGGNCAEAVNFGLTSWLPAARAARPCTCDGHQSPHIDLPLLMRRVKQAYPQAASDWWCFCCRCGETCTNFDDQVLLPDHASFDDGCRACSPPDPALTLHGGTDVCRVCPLPNLAGGVAGGRAV